MVKLRLTSRRKA